MIQVLQTVREFLQLSEMSIDAEKSKLKAVVPTPKYVPSKYVTFHI